MADTAPLLRLAPDWTPSTSPLPIVRTGTGRHRAPGGPLTQLRARLSAGAQRHFAATALFVVVHLGGPGGAP